MQKQTNKIKRSEEISRDRMFYNIEEKLFNITTSQEPEQSWKFSGRDL